MERFRNLIKGKGENRELFQVKIKLFLSKLLNTFSLIKDIIGYLEMKMYLLKVQYERKDLYYVFNISRKELIQNILNILFASYLIFVLYIVFPLK